MAVAIVEDDKSLAMAISTYLDGRSLHTRCFTKISDVLNSDFQFSVILLDLHLEDGNSISSITHLQKQRPNTKIIVMTGFDSLPVRLQSFGYGAFDYLKKPIFPAELYARIMRFTKQEKSLSPSLVNTVLFTTTESAIISILIESLGVPVSSEELCDRITCSKSALYTNISRIKAKCGEKYHIKSAYGRGWYIETQNTSNQVL